MQMIESMTKEEYKAAKKQLGIKTVAEWIALLCISESTHKSYSMGRLTPSRQVVSIIKYELILQGIKQTQSQDISEAEAILAQLHVLFGTKGIPLPEEAKVALDQLKNLLKNQK